MIDNQALLIAGAILFHAAVTCTTETAARNTAGFAALVFLIAAAI